ncbi:MAG: radical SAM protein [Planctomycetota bacterium]|jgi:MoaA/NifB/PqqE/SkfB family radical SAM enzyme
MKKAKLPTFEGYLKLQREVLLKRMQRREWAALLERSDVLRQWRGETKKPPTAPSQQVKANEYLRKRNAERVKKRIRQGVTDEKELVGILGSWETALKGDDAFPIVFLGLVLTLDCTFMPRCLYCNQVWLPRQLTVDDWKAVLREAADPIPPYVYLSGGEPLMTGAEVWGDQGLVAFATDLGCAVNINTNAFLITPHVALQLVKNGLSKIHISLDTQVAELQDELLGGSERVDAVLGGLFNILIARELLGANHPQIHINCVLTSRNLFQFPDLFRFILDTRQVRSPGFEGAVEDDPLFMDFAFHCIPVGGTENAFLRPTAADWKRFYTETWDEAQEVWGAYQSKIGVAEDQQKPIEWFAPFGSPYHRAEHGMNLDEYCVRAGRGNYWQGALTDRCYVAPTQAFVLPDGSQHWCGAHAIRRPPSLGNIKERSLRENILANMHRWKEVPNDTCTGCAGATCVINQAALNNLKEQVAKWVSGQEA